MNIANGSMSKKQRQRQGKIQMVMEQLDVHTGGDKEHRHRFWTLYKSELKWVSDLAVNCQTIYHKEIPRWPWVQQRLSKYTPKAWSVKEILEKLKFIKIKSSLESSNVKRKEAQATD